MIMISNNNKGNPNHDENGRFTSKGSQGSGAPKQQQIDPQKIYSQMGLSQEDVAAEQERQEKVSALKEQKKDEINKEQEGRQEALNDLGEKMDKLEGNSKALNQMGLDKIDDSTNREDKEIQKFLQKKADPNFSFDFISSLNEGNDKETVKRWTNFQANMYGLAEDLMKEKGWEWPKVADFLNSFMDRYHERINQARERMIAKDEQIYMQNKERYDQILDNELKNALQYGVKVNGDKKPLSLDENWYDDVWYRLPKELRNNNSVLRLLKQKLKSGEYNYKPKKYNKK